MIPLYGIAAIAALHLLPILYVWLFAIYNAAQTLRTDAPPHSEFWTHSVADWQELGRKYKDQVFRFLCEQGEETFTREDLWYFGTNRFYSPPGSIRKADAWHTWKITWVCLLSFLFSSGLLLGAYLAAWVLIFGPSVFWLADTILVLIGGALLYWLKGGLFHRYYNLVLDKRYNGGRYRFEITLARLILKR